MSDTDNFNTFVDAATMQPRICVDSAPPLRRLVISHPVCHKVVEPICGQPESVVSTLKQLRMSVELRDGSDCVTTDHDVPLPLEATLVFENEETVPAFHGHPLVIGQYASLSKGRATLPLTVTQLSSTHSGKRFRLRGVTAIKDSGIVPTLTGPMRVITKLYRKPTSDTSATPAATSDKAAPGAPADDAPEAVNESHSFGNATVSVNSPAPASHSASTPAVCDGSSSEVVLAHSVVLLGQRLESAARVLSALQTELVGAMDILGSLRSRRGNVSVQPALWAKRGAVNNELVLYVASPSNTWRSNARIKDRSTRLIITCLLPTKNQGPRL